MKKLLSLFMILLLWGGPTFAQVPNPASVTATLQNGAAANGNGGSLLTNVAGFGFQVVTLTVTGTFTATVNPEGSMDSTNWQAISCLPVNGGASVTTFTAAGGWRCNLGGGYTQVRARISGYSSGSVTVIGTAAYLGSARLFDNAYDTLILGAMTSGSVIFAGTGGLLSQDNTNLFFDTTLKRLLLGKDLMFVSGSATAPDGTTRAGVSFPTIQGNVNGLALSVLSSRPVQLATAEIGLTTRVWASDAVAGSSVAGAAQGGLLELRGGDAKFLTSGSANGGNINVLPGGGVGSTGSIGRTVLGGLVNFQFVGPHIIGTTTSGGGAQLTINGTWDPTVPSVGGGPDARGIYHNSTILPGVNGSADGILLSPVINKAASGTHADFTTLNLSAPTVGAGAAALTNVSVIKVTGSGSGGTNGYGIWNIGNQRQDGTLFGGTTLTLAALTGNNLLFGRVASVVPGAFTEDMRLTSGILAIGATNITGGDAAAAGDLVFKNGSGVKINNIAGTALTRVIELTTDGNNRVLLAGGGADIQWNRANIALGGGAAPTFGTIGGSGPAAAGQRNWLRFIENDGTASFIPVWR